MKTAYGKLDRDEVISNLEMAARLVWDGEHCNIMDDDDALTVSYAIADAINLLKDQEPRKPHYTRLEYIVEGKTVSVKHPECPWCFEHGLLLWDAEIERGVRFCKRCGQEVKWDE